MGEETRNLDTLVFQLFEFLSLWIRNLYRIDLLTADGSGGLQLKRPAS
jgi:hypothetical protein